MSDRIPTSRLVLSESWPFAPLEIKRPKHERLWLALVVLLSLPAVVFILLHQLFIAFPHLNAEWPETLGAMLSWTLAFTGAHRKSPRTKSLRMPTISMPIVPASSQSMTFSPRRGRSPGEFAA